MFTCSGDSTVKVFESKSGTCKRTFTGHGGPVNCFTVSLTNNELSVIVHVTLFLSSELRMWDI